MPMHANTNLVLIGVLSALTAPQAGHAQETNKGSGIDEVVVTATRREQSLQSVPIAVTAITGDALDNARIENPDDIAVVTPGLQVGYQGGGLVLYLRGVGASDVSAGQESAIATYVDGVYMAEPYGNHLAFNNIERVEVLRGPQGTLFGRNATGGLLNIITKDPSEEAAVDARVSYGNYDTFGARFYGTTGVTDNLAADLAVYYKDQGEGYGENLVNGKDTNYGKELSFRTKWLFTPGDNTHISLTADHEDIEGDTGIAYSIVPPGRALADGQPHAGGFYDINANIQPFQRVDAWGVALNARHSLSAVDLVSITAYRKNRIHFGFDNDITPVPGVDVDIFTRRDSFSQELQVVSNTDSKLTWIAGLFYFDDEAGYGPPHGLSLQGVFLPTAPAGPNIKNMIDTKSYSAYGEGTYSITDDTRMTLGARYTRDERTLHGKIDVYLPGVGFVAEVPTPRIKKTFKKPSFRAVLDHDFTDDIFGYVSYNRGFKSGNFNTVDATNPPFEPETLDAYETGLKTQWLDNRLRMNFAVFHYKYKNMQFVTQQGVTTQTKNAAGAEIDGAELDASWSITDQFSLTAAASYVDAEYTKFPEGTCTTPNPTGGNIVGTCDVKGNKVLRTPEWTLSLMPSYRFSTAIGDIDASVTYNYNDGFFWHPENRLKEKPYDLVNADVTWSRPGNPISITLYGRNLLDEGYSLYTETGPLANQYSAAAPLTWGAEFRVQF